MSSASSMSALPEIDVPHDVIVTDLVHAALGQDRAPMEYRDPGREVPDEVHVVLDYDDGRPPVDLAHEVGRSARLGVGHPCRWLVEQYQFGLGRQHHADFDPLAVAVGKVAH